jgi:hypothetical protein
VENSPVETVQLHEHTLQPGTARAAGLGLADAERN